MPRDKKGDTVESKGDDLFLTRRGTTRLGAEPDEHLGYERRTLIVPGRPRGVFIGD